MFAPSVGKLQGRVVADVFDARQDEVSGAGRHVLRAACSRRFRTRRVVKPRGAPETRSVVDRLTPSLPFPFLGLLRSRMSRESSVEIALHKAGFFHLVTHFESKTGNHARGPWNRPPAAAGDQSLVDAILLKN